MQEIEFFSADLSAIWATTPYVWPHHWTLEPGPEGELYPGATVLALVVIGLGAYVRLSDAGLGCPDWPGCYGHSNPLSAAEPEPAHAAWTGHDLTPAPEPAVQP